MRITRLILLAFAAAAGETWAQEAPIASPEAASPGLDFLMRGGAMVWPILLTVLAGLGFAIERAIHLRRGLHVPKEFHKDVVHVVDTRGVDAGVGRCMDNPSSLSRALYAALMRYGAGRRDMETAVLAECRRIQYDLSRNTRVIGVLCVVAPLLGLLGTTLGLMEHFQIAAMFSSHSGIPDALVPAALGLAATILLLGLYFVLKMRAEDFVREIEEHAIEAVLTLDRKARQSIRLIDDIEEQIPTKDMPVVKSALPPDLEKEFEDAGREGSGVKTSITTHANLPAANPDAQRKVDAAEK